jgi:MFS family permease
METSAGTLRSFHHPAAALAVLLSAPFLASADATIANVATPAIRVDLGGSGQAAQFVIGGYLIAYAVLLITGARLGQTHGYRRLFLLGMGVFGAASLAAGLAPDIRVLIGLRVVQGAGAALMFPQALTGIQLNFTGPRRARAISLFALALSAGAVFGQVLGGVLVSADLAGTDWRPIFLVNVPVCLAVAACARRILPADEPRSRARVDLPGVAALSVTVLLIVVPLTFGPAAGWPGWTWASLGASLPAFAVFLASQRRAAAAGRPPLVHVAVLARPAVAWGLAAMLASTGTYFALLFTVAQYEQVGRGRSALVSGLILIPWVTAFGAAGQIVRRLPAGRTAVLPAAGFLLLTAAYAAIGAALLGGVLSEGLLAALFVAGGLGLGTVFTTLLGHLTSAVPARHAPDISGVFTTTGQIGGSIGVAGFGSLYLATASGADGGHAFGVTALALAGAALLGTVPAWLASRAAVPVAAAPTPAARPRSSASGQEVAAGWGHAPSRAASRS